ncbi:MAG TPA: hypothetical protein VLI06_14435, partial [Solimonas sp.]|nr:hypothetical protein [Solimonas sp.]
RVIAVARIMMPKAYVRLSAGRTAMSDEVQAWCFFAGANSIFYGEKLLTTQNPQNARDRALFARLGIQPEGGSFEPAAADQAHAHDHEQGCCAHEPPPAAMTEACATQAACAD